MFEKTLSERVVWKDNFRFFRSKKKEELIKTLRCDELKKIKLIMFLSKRSSVVRFKTKFKIEHHNKYLNLKLSISNENDFKDLFKCFFFKKFIKLFKWTIENLKLNECSRSSSDESIISRKKSFLKSKNNNYSKSSRKKLIIKLTNKSWLSIIRR